MDYLNEAEMQRNLNLHKHNEMIAVPKIYKEITSRRVLTMDGLREQINQLRRCKKIRNRP